MITSLDVSNYKSIKSLSLDLPPFMVLVGPNGAGKTNVVRALELLGHLLARGTTEPAREQGWAQIVHREKRPARGGLRLSVTLSIPQRSRVGVARLDAPMLEARVGVTLRGKVNDRSVSVVSEEFHLKSKVSELSLQWKAGAWKSDLGKDPVLWSMFWGSSSAKEADDRLGVRLQQRDLFPDLDEPTDLRLLNRSLGSVFHDVVRRCGLTRLRLDASSLRSDARFQADGDHSLGPTGEGLPVAVDRLRGRGIEPAAAFRPVLDALREVYPRIEDVRPEMFGQGRVTLGFIERGIADPIPLDGVSDGVLHALALLVALDAGGPGILAIEEPENALHPWSVRKILERAQTQGDRQVLITTHSETVVNAVTNPDSLFIVEGDEGGTTVQRATSNETALASILKETGQKLGDVWIDGSLGGVPVS
jgi:predicted ATPase